MYVHVKRVQNAFEKKMHHHHNCGILQIRQVAKLDYQLSNAVYNIRTYVESILHVSITFK